MLDALGHLRIVRQRLELLWLLWLRSYWGSAAVSRCVRAVAGTAPACAARPRGQCLTHGLTWPCAAASLAFSYLDPRGLLLCANEDDFKRTIRKLTERIHQPRLSPPRRCKGSQPPPQWPAGYSQA